MTPEQMMGMIRAGHDVEHVLDIASAESNAEFRCWLLKESGPEAVARYDAKIKDIDSGVYGARGTWHALSAAQRHTLVEIGKSQTGKVHLASGGRSYLLNFYPFGCGRIGVKATIRNLCSRDLLAWDGGTFEPERVAVITERGRFVLQHGPTKTTG